MKTKAVYRIFIFVLVFSPLAFGTVEQWSLAVMETASLLALCLLILSNVRHEGAPFREVPGFIPLMLFMAFMVLQLVPLPPPVLKFLSPDTFSLYRNTVWTAGPVGWGSLSVCREATLKEFLRIASYGAFYVLTVQLLSKKEDLKRAVSALVLLASLIAFFAILQDILSNGRIYWVRELTLGGNPFGPYVNRDDYAGLMEMLFPVVLSLFLFNRPYTGYGSFRERIVEAFNQRRTNLYVLLGLSAVLIATSVFLCLSRGGIISLSLSMIFFGLMIVNQRRKGKKGALIIIIAALIVLSVGWFGWGPIVERFRSLRDAQGGIYDMRLDIWKDCLEIMRRFPLTGTGFGTFSNIYPKFRTISAAGHVLEHAHNDYLELAAEGGIIACVLAGWFLFAVLHRSFRAFGKRREPYSVYLFVGSIAGLLSIFIHSLTDFNLHIGANGLYFFFLLGLVVSAANTRLRDGAKMGTLLRKTEFRPGRLAVAAFMLFFACTVVLNIGILAGKYFSLPAKEISMNSRISRKELADMKHRAYRASRFDPWEGRYHYQIGNADWLSSNMTGAVAQYREALRLDPANAAYLQTLGLAMAGAGNNSEAGKLLLAGVDCDISNPARYKVYASWLLARGRKAAALGYVNRAIALEPQRTGDYITLMVVYGLDDEDIGKSLPERTQPHLSFADYLAHTGRAGLAEKEYLSALGYVTNEKVIRPSYFLHVYSYLEKENKVDDALMVMREAINALPEDVSVRLTAAEAYERAGIRYKAVEEYRKALLIDPGNAKAKKKLADLG
ncbi:MAG: O-antigen ligase family protein [Candidatus Sulfobium sp.]